MTEQNAALKMDLAHKRPILLASLILGLSYPMASHFISSDPILLVWKMAGVGLLVFYALRRHHEREFALLAAFLGFYALGDGLIELDQRAGALAFIIGHIIAIYLYFRHRRVHPTISQKMLAIALLLLTPVIAFALPYDRGIALQTGLYAVFLSSMAAMAWSSNFSRYRVGIGAVLFVFSDLMIFAREGLLANWPPVHLIIWYSYYCGVFMIAVGIAQTLIKRGHYSSSD